MTVRICGDVNVPADIDAVRVAFTDDMFRERVAGVLVLAEGDAGTGITLPIDTELAQRSGGGFLRVDGLDDGVEVIRFDRRLKSFEIERVDATLLKACRGADCPDGQTCVLGQCTLAPEGVRAGPRCDP